MENLLTKLNDSEIERLDDFLLDRIHEQVATEDRDEGVLDISELDGLFTAIVSGPAMIPPSQWLPVMWGDFEPVRRSEARIGRNDPCPCGSGKKYKKCCLH